MFRKTPLKKVPAAKPAAVIALARSQTMTGSAEVARRKRPPLPQDARARVANVTPTETDHSLALKVDAPMTSNVRQFLQSSEVGGPR